MCPERRTLVALYSPGGGVAIAAPEAWLYVDAPPNDPLVTSTWTHLQDDGALRRRVEEVAEELSNAEVAFGLVARLDGALVVVLGGEAEAEIEATGASESLRCPAALRRVDHRFRQLPTSVRLSLQGDVQDGSTLLPLGVGVASAGQVLLSPAADATRPSEPTVAGDGAVGVPATDQPSQRPASLAVGGELATSGAVTNGAANGSHLVASGIEDAAVAASELSATEEADSAEEGSATTEGSATGEARASATEEGDDSSGGYGFLFGHTVNRTVADAAVQPPAEEEPPQLPAAAPEEDALRGADTLWEVPAEAGFGASGGAEAAPDGQGSPRSAPDRDPAPAPVPSNRPDPTLHTAQGAPAKAGAMIDSVPWSVVEEPTPGRPVAAAAPPAPVGAPVAPAAVVGPAPADAADALELTMSRQTANALAQRIAAEAAPPSPGPTVHAVHCSSGHPNPPQADLCRVCGMPVASQPPVTVPRPVLGYLRFSTGDVIPLDRNVLIGRQPAIDRLVDGMRPHVVKVPSPERDVSRNHLEIRLDDWHVLATDLDSTNGTILLRPGCPPERLRPAQATMIEPGTRVSLADDVSFAFEAK